MILDLQFFEMALVIAIVYIFVILNHILQVLRRLSQANDSIDERGDLDSHVVDIKARRRHLLTLCRRKYIRSRHLGQ